MSACSALDLSCLDFTCIVLQGHSFLTEQLRFCKVYFKLLGEELPGCDHCKLSNWKVLPSVPIVLLGKCQWRWNCPEQRQSQKIRQAGRQAIAHLCLLLQSTRPATEKPLNPRELLVRIWLKPTYQVCAFVLQFTLSSMSSPPLIYSSSSGKSASRAL